MPTERKAGPLRAPRPIGSLSQMALVKSVTADSDGEFGFGQLKAVRYTLVIDNIDWGWSHWFNVEVRDQPRETESVLIDGSPILPDCSGGHEFVMKSKSITTFRRSLNFGSVQPR